MSLPTTGAVRRRRLFHASALAAGLLAFAPAALATDLAVTISGVRSNQGDVYAAVFAKSDKFPEAEAALKYVKVKASTAPIEVRFDDLPPGVYAVGAYHDENANGTLDTDLFGYPTEGYALSRGIRVVNERPHFEQAAFRIDGASAHAELNIRY